MKNKNTEFGYLSPLALQMKIDLEIEDIKICISVLTTDEKKELAKTLKTLKEDNIYVTNKKIYECISLLLDISEAKERKKQKQNNF